MKGFVLFRHAVLQVFGNFKMALRLTAPLYAIQSLVVYDFQRRFGAELTELSVQTQGFWFSWFVVIAVTGIVGLWIAVVWHRFILIEETDVRMVPKFRLDRILAYFGVGLMLAFLLMVPFAMVLGLAMRWISNPLTALIVVLVPLVLVFYRLSPVLPAAALGEGLKMKDAWESTKSGTGAIFTLALIFTVLGAISSVLIPSLFLTNPTLTQIILPVFDWLYLLIGVSILTTIYGHYVEGRELV